MKLMEILDSSIHRAGDTNSFEKITQSESALVKVPEILEPICKFLIKIKQFGPLVKLHNMVKILLQLFCLMLKLQYDNFSIIIFIVIRKKS